MNTELSTARWFKSSHSGPDRDCVEAAFLDGDRVGVRDSKNLGDPALIFSPAEWDSFAAGVKEGRFDRT